MNRATFFLVFCSLIFVQFVFSNSSLKATDLNQIHLDFDRNENEQIDEIDADFEDDEANIYWVDAEKWTGLFDKSWTPQKRFKGSEHMAWKNCVNYLSVQMANTAIFEKRCVYR